MTTPAEQEAREIVEDAIGRLLNKQERLYLIEKITAALSSRDEALSAAKAEVERLMKAVDHELSEHRYWQTRTAAAESREAEARKVMKQIADLDRPSGHGLTADKARRAVELARAFLSPPSPEPSK